MPTEKQHSFLRLRQKRNPKPEEERPAGYGKYSNATYYTYENAMAIKAALDSLDPDNKVKEKVFLVNKYRSVNTVYQTLYQGFRFLVERLDTPDKKYANLRALLSLRRERDRVRMYWNGRSTPTINGVDVNLTGIDVDVDPDSIPISWKEEIVKWATESEDGNVEEKKISLSNEEIAWLRDYLSGFPNIVCVRINNAGFKLAKNATLAAAIREERGE